MHRNTEQPEAQHDCHSSAPECATSEGMRQTGAEMQQAAELIRTSAELIRANTESNRRLTEVTYHQLADHLHRLEQRVADIEALLDTLLHTHEREAVTQQGQRANGATPLCSRRQP